MYQGNEHKKSRKRTRKTKKSMALLASFLLLMCVTIGGTVAFLVDSSDVKANIFTPSKVTTEVVETRDGQTKSNVKIQNTGDTEAYIRAAVVVTWQDEAGNVYGQKPVSGTDYEMTFNTDKQQDSEGKDIGRWVLAEDGFYYWTEPVNGAREDGFDEDDPKTFTGVLIASCTVKENADSTVPDTYFLNVEIIGSGIQSKPTNAVTSAWSSGVNEFASDDSTTLNIKVKSD